MKHIYSGTGVALITPFRKDGSVDFNALDKLVKHVINGGLDFLVVMGTTAEAVTLSNDERQAVINYIKEVNNNKLPIILGIGGNNTQEVVSKIKQTDFEGISGILSVAPYYNKPNQTGLYKHFKEIATACPVNVVLYNVPGRTCSNISADTAVKLANDFKNIVAIKEASGDFNQIMQIIQNKPEGFEVISGDDALTLPLISIGVKGVISVTANAFPFEMSEMVANAIKYNGKKAQTMHYKLLDFTNAIFEDGNPAGIKAALEVLDIVQNYLRLPLVKVNRTLYKKIEKLVHDIKNE